MSRAALSMPHSRSRRCAVAWVPVIAMMATLALPAMLAGCGSAPPPGPVQTSLLSPDRTFDAALGALGDQKMVVEVQDRRFGRLVGTLNGDTVTVVLTPEIDSTIRVRFAQQGSNDPELLQRVLASYAARTGNQSILGGFRDSGNNSGPLPCPSGPAFCK